MIPKPKTNPKKPTQVVGIRLPENFVVAFKKEAAARNIRLNELFLELWDLYQTWKQKKA